MTSNQPCPHIGDDTFDVIEDAVATLAERRRAWPGGDELTSIALIASLIQQAERFLPQLVHDARANGIPWPQIAHALGTTLDDAQRRFDPNAPNTNHRRPGKP